MTRLQPRPWYVSDAACDDYGQTLRDGGDLRMLKALKVLRSIVVNIGVLVLSVYGLYLGGPPAIIVPLALLVVGAYNGLELTDYLALLRAYDEVKSGDSDD